MSISVEQFQTLCLKLIWRLFSARDSLCADWLRNNRLKDEFFWSIDENKQTSWTWKTLLHLRPLASQFIRCKVGNGRTVSFWFDWWTPLGPLITLMGHSCPTQTGIPLTGSVAHACSLTGWHLRPARSPQAELLQIHLTTIAPPFLSTEQDHFVWKIGEEQLDNFSTKKTWDILRQRQQPQNWTQHVWFKGAVPRHAFMLWVTHLDRLPTITRLANWGLQVETSCCICGNHPESREHLFLHCDFSEELWLQATRRLGYTPFVFHTWEAFSTWLDIKDSISPQTLRRLVAQVIIYAIWIERNNRYHNNTSTTTHVLFKAIDMQVRDAIIAKNHRKNFRQLMCEWLRLA